MTDTATGTGSTADGDHDCGNDYLSIVLLCQT